MRGLLQQTMMVRELKQFKWIYTEGTVTLVDKQSGKSFSLPLRYLDSLTRAGLTFKNRFRAEQVRAIRQKHHGTKNV